MMYHIRAKLAMLAAAEAPRLVLFAPVLLGLGILSCLLPRAEPPVWIAPALLVGGGLVAWAGRRHWPVLVLAAALLLLGAGHGAARLRILAVAGPIPAAGARPVTVSGVVAEVEHQPGGDRVVIRDPWIQGLRKPPRSVRLRFSRPAPPIGAKIRVRAVLMPPPAPALPGAHDFQRDLWFQGIGAIGFALGEATVVGAAPVDASLWLQKLRADLARRIGAAVPGPSGQVLVALFAGVRDGIPEEINEDLRDSGLYHMLSISGLHIAMVAGIGFALARLLLLLIQPWALTAPVKKYAAVAALLVTLAYMILVGVSAPTLRSVVMVALGMLAIVVDRSPFSLRLLAVAATLVLVMQPEALLGASFQMSFAAALALIAGFEALETRSWWRLKPDGWLARGGRIALALAVTSLLASLATAPYAWYHFQRLQLYGIVANMIAVPLSSVWVMPLGLLGYPLLAADAEAWAYVPAGWGMDLILWLAKTVAAWPGAAITLPVLPPLGLGLMSAGLLLLCLLRTRLRLAGLVLILAGGATYPLVQTPQILADSGRRLLAVAEPGGHAFSRTTGYQAEVWRRTLQIEKPPRLTGGGRSFGKGIGPCAPGEALWRLKPFRLVLCGRGRPQIFDETRAQTLSARWDGAAWRIATVQAERGRRPWVGKE